MSKAYLPHEPDQELLLPEDHLAYLTCDVVDQLNLSGIAVGYEREERGGPPYNPRWGILLSASLPHLHTKTSDDECRLVSSVIP